MEYLIDYSCRTEGHVVFFRGSSLVILFVVIFFFMLEYEKRVAKFYSFKSLKTRYYCPISLFGNMVLQIYFYDVKKYICQ